MMSESGGFHGFGNVPQRASRVGMKMSWKHGEISSGSVVLDLLNVRGIIGLQSVSLSLS